MEYTSLAKRIKLEEDESPENARENTEEFDEKLIKLEPIDGEEEETNKKYKEIFDNGVKLEPVMENVKEEVLDDEYFERNIPKLEPYEETETATSSGCSENTYWNPVHSECDNYEDRNASSSSKHRRRRRRCQLCNKSKMGNNMKNVTMGSEKIILISIYFEDFITTAHATKFLTATPCLVCVSHYPDAVSKLQEYLIQLKKMNSLMNTVKFFRSSMTSENFHSLSRRFVEKHQSAVEVKWTQNEKPPDFCSICDQITQDVTIVSWKVVKLVLMIGCILQGTHTIKYARPFVLAEKTTYAVCDSHFATSLDEICKALRIENHLDLNCCHVREVENLLKIINSIYPNMQWIQFHNLLIELGTRTGKFKAMKNVQ